MGTLLLTKEARIYNVTMIVSSISDAGKTAKLLQSCPTLCDPIDGSPPGSPVPGIIQARTLEWAAISFSNAWKWKVKVKSLSHVRPSATLWTAAFQAPPSMGFSRQGYWSRVPLKTWQLQKNEIRTLPNTICKDKLKWIKDVNERRETIKPLEENRQNNQWRKSQQDPLWPTS